MRTIKYAAQFKRDYKREKKSSRHKSTVDKNLLDVVRLLSCDKPLLKRHCDHALTGNWKSHRDCHIKPDLILIYRKPDMKLLELIRIGSHSKLGL